MGPTKAMESTDKTRKMRGPTLQIGEESKKIWKKSGKMRKNVQKLEIKSPNLINEQDPIRQLGCAEGILNSRTCTAITITWHRTHLRRACLV